MKKRLFDLVLAIPALVFLAPVTVVLILLLRISVGKEVFFYQNRPGLHGKPFRICKFRSMTDERGKAGNYGLGAGEWAECKFSLQFRL